MAQIMWVSASMALLSMRSHREKRKRLGVVAVVRKSALLKSRVLVMTRSSLLALAAFALFLTICGAPFLLFANKL